MRKITPDDALEYHHLGGKPAKLAIVPTKPMATQHDLALAYTPGVAVPVLAIAQDPIWPTSTRPRATWWR